MDKLGIIKALSENKEQLLNRFNITRIGLFGSYSSGRQASTSDVDLLYELKSNAKLGLREIYELECYLKDILSIERIDLVDKQYINPVVELEINDQVIYV